MRKYQLATDRPQICVVSQNLVVFWFSIPWIWSQTCFTIGTDGYILPEGRIFGGSFQVAFFACFLEVPGLIYHLRRGNNYIYVIGILILTVD